MPIITAKNDGQHYKTIIDSTNHVIIADEPIANGGTDEGMSPVELLQASLAACTNITLRMYASKKGWQLDNVETEVNFEIDTVTKKSTFTRKIKLVGKLSEEEKERLMFIAEKCFIHKVLTNEIEISTIMQ